MTELQQYQLARREGRDVRVRRGSGDPFGELRDLYRRQEALKRAAELGQKLRIRPTGVIWPGDPESAQEYDSDAKHLAQVDAELEALKLALGRFDPPEEE